MCAVSAAMTCCFICSSTSYSLIVSSSGASILWRMAGKLGVELNRLNELDDLDNLDELKASWCSACPTV